MVLLWGEGTLNKPDRVGYISHKRVPLFHLLKYEANSCCAILSLIPVTTLLYKALILQGKI